MIYNINEYVNIKDDKRIDFQIIRDYATESWRLDETHGLPHWERVERNGILLYSSGVNLTVVRLFAYLHDKCRKDNAKDIDHGKRSAELVKSLRNSLLSNLSDNEIDTLYKACYLHTIKRKTGDITIDTCFDADRLDLPRVGMTPEANKMATIKGAHFASHPKEYKAAIVDFENWLKNRR